MILAIGRLLFVNIGKIREKLSPTPPAGMVVTKPRMKGKTVKNKMGGAPKFCRVTKSL